ncbi:transposase [Erysipelotrichaceae bacterium 51-3]
MPGFYCALHTRGQKLDFHPHIHVVFCAGALSDSGEWVTPKKTTRDGKTFLFPVKELAAYFKNEFMSRGETGYVKRYKELIESNSLLFACDLVKEQLIEAYSCDDEIKMADKITTIINTCRGTKNEHFRWFARLLENHFEGIISHASYGISSGKIEGVNNKIKTVRRQAFGYHDDGYFFLKIIDASYQPTVKNPKSHRIFQ